MTLDNKTFLEIKILQKKHVCFTSLLAYRCNDFWRVAKSINSKLYIDTKLE